VAGLAHDLAGPDALAEFRASRRLVEIGGPAVADLARLAGDAGASLPARLIAVELLGRIATPAARDGLLERLKVEKNLALRGQLCMQLGPLREARAIPVIERWLDAIGPNSLNDIGGQPKESQPGTCYIRHIEALGQIGDERAIPILDAFRKKIPQGIGYGGFLTHFVTGAVDETVADLKVEAAFRARVRQTPGLEAQTDLLFAHFRADPLARFRLYEDEIIRGTDSGRAILARLAGGDDARLAAAAKALLAHYSR
jgi:hypothetical protein